MSIPEACRAFWVEFAASVDFDPTPRFHSAFHFCDTEALANSLGRLALAGTKRATTGLLWSYEAENEALPKVGQLSIVTDFAGVPMCVIEAVAVDVVAFGDVTEAYARREGEGDKSLRYWLDAHWRFFVCECAQLDREPTLQMPVVCEEFEVVYPPAPGRAAS